MFKDIKYIRRLTGLIGLLSMIFSAFLLPPLLVSWWYHDGEFSHLLDSMLVMLLLGLLLWFPVRNEQGALRRRDGFLIVVLFWTLLSVLAAVPLILALHTSFVDSLFEAVSGFTTTGATVLVGLDKMQPSILFYRQELQWVGGMGLVVFALALLPMLGIGGVALYRAELPGPVKDEKMMPSLYKGVRVLWLIYVGLTVACAVAYWLLGMNVFDAVAHSLATVSTGGFSTHDDSIGYFHSAAIDNCVVVFMLLGAVNFSVHYLVLNSGDWRQYFRNMEVKTFLLFVAVIVAVETAGLWFEGTYRGVLPSLHYALFEGVSVITSTGFGIADFSVWPLFMPVLLLFAGFVGGCGGSTAGGLKVMRVLVLGRLAWREVRQLIHPKAVLPVMLEGRAIPELLLQSMLGFFSIYIVTFVVLMLAMMAVGESQVTAFSATATCINNIGPGLGEVATNFASISPAGKMLAVAAMLLGRLEIYTLLVLLTPAFWRG